MKKRWKMYLRLYWNMLLIKLKLKKDDNDGNDFIY